MAIYSILPSTNLRYQDIRDTLNANGGTVGNTSADANSAWSAASNINDKSWIKPVRLNKLFNLSLNDFRSADYGWGIPAYSNYTDAKNAYTLGERWSYLRPRGMSYNEPLRIGDFRGYDTTNQIIISFSPIATSVKIDSSVRIEIPDWGELLNMGSWSGYGPVYLSLHLFAVCPATGGIYQVDNDSLTFSDIISNGFFNVPFPDTEFDAGQNIGIFPLITTYALNPGVTGWFHPSTTSGTWWILPVEPIVFSLLAPPSSEDNISFFGVEESSNVVFHPNGYVTINTIGYSVVNDNNESYKSSITVKVTSPFMSPNTQTIGSTSITLPANDYISGTINCGGFYFEPMDTGIVSVTLELWYSDYKGGHTMQTTLHFSE